MLARYELLRTKFLAPGSRSIVGSATYLVPGTTFVEANDCAIQRTAAIGRQGRSPPLTLPDTIWTREDKANLATSVAACLP
jgi:hypothetical protein